MARFFDAYLVVDWSAAATPKRGADSIWFCHLASGGRRRVENPATREAAARRLEAIIAHDLEKGRSLLAGFDFPFAYPAELAARLGLRGAPWRALWDELARVVTDGPDNRNNRFEAAAGLNHRISGTAFPFWACPAGEAGPSLAMRHHRRHGEDGLAEHRLTEHRVRGPQPTWKLAGTGSAGGQALTGIPVVRRLRDRFEGAAAVWPFETGLGATPCRPGVVFAEIYPSLVAAPQRPGECKDSAQVRALADDFAARDRQGMLAPLLAADPALTTTERRTVLREEGWILGVVSETRRPKRAPSNPSALTAYPPPPPAGEGRGGGGTRRTLSKPASRLGVPPSLPSPRKRGRG